MSLARAIETGDLAELPSRRDEDWRWTDLRGLIRELPEASPVAEGALSVAPFAALDAEEFAIVNGRGPYVITVANDAGPRVVALRIIAAANAQAHVASVHVVVGVGGRLTLLESYEGDASEYLANTELTISLRNGAQLERIILADDAASGVSVSIANIRSMGPGASFAQTVLTTGARRQRLETHVTHPGAGASVRLDGVYLLADQRHADITTVVTHTGTDGTTSQLTKGVVRDQARGVFQGRIVVSPGADKTDARMGHHALILSARAEVDAKPELLIYADDVACAHGNTVGALDEDALFYAEQRGIPEAEAKAMLTEAFVGEVVDRIDHEGARDVVRAWVAERLRGAA
ncbi:MAG TPA: Fe-S cluster assembly protein SufD [Caulobacteraceae bacterium]|jgi:Fe-S cluster assembly protein SufD|nr:Fe-S cluster assembly protein SufD [Caulobacteraceae bacterium]